MISFLPKRVDFSKLRWETPVPGIRYKIYRQGDKQIRFVELKSGFVESDWCTRGHIGYILKGKLKVKFVDKSLIFNYGDAFSIPAGRKSKHKAYPLTSLVRLFLVEDDF